MLGVPPETEGTVFGQCVSAKVGGERSARLTPRPEAAIGRRGETRLRVDFAGWAGIELWVRFASRLAGTDARGFPPAEPAAG